MSRPALHTSCVALLLLLAACGRGPESLSPIRRHLSMRPPEDDSQLLGTTVWRRIHVLRDQPDWEQLALHSEVGAATFDGQDQSVLWLDGPVGDPPVLEVRIPGEFDPAEFNEFQVTVLAPEGEFELSCSLLRGGERVLTSEAIGIAARRTPQTLGLALPRTHQSEQPFDHLAITFRGSGPRVGLISVHLRERSLRSFLPSPRSTPRLIRIEDEWRAAVGLSSRRPLEGRVHVPMESALVLHFAVPSELELPDRQDSVRVSITNDEGRETALRISLGPESEVQFVQGPPASEFRRGRPQSGKQRGKQRRRRGPAPGPKKRQKGPPPPAGAFEEVEAPVLEPLVHEPRVRLESTWSKLKIPLDEFAGEEVTVRVELVDWPEFESVCAVTPPVVVRATSQPTTVLLITAGSMRADHLGASGSEVEIDTALLDQLARSGVLFEDCYTPSTDTHTSLRALMTGTWPPTAAASEDAPSATLATRFRQAGYATWAVLGSAQLNPEFSDLTQGFDRVLAPTLGERNASETIEQLTGRIDKLAGSPVFVWLHLPDPEGPYAPPENFRHEYYPRSENPYSRKLPELAPHMRPAWDPELRDPAWASALYRSEITYLDRRLRNVFELPRVRRGGIVAVTSDHGENLTGHGTWFTHTELCPDTLAVPLLLSFPQAPGGRRVPRPVSTVDLGRTLLDLAQLEDSSFPGRHLLRREDRDTAAPRFAFSAEERAGAIAAGGADTTRSDPRVGYFTTPLRVSFSPQSRSAAVQAQDWFLTLQLGDPEPELETDAVPRHQARLYDLAQDPTCRTDVFEQHPEEGRELRQFVVEWLEQAALGALDLPPLPGAECECAQCSNIR